MKAVVRHFLHLGFPFGQEYADTRLCCRKDYWSIKLPTCSSLCRQRETCRNDTGHTLNTLQETFAQE